MTVERDKVARAPWPVCTLCGLAAPDVRIEPLTAGSGLGELRCPDKRRCAAAVVLTRKQFIFEPRDPNAGTEPPPPDFKGEKPPAGSWRDFLNPPSRKAPK